MQAKFLWISVMLAVSSANVYAAGFGLIDNSVANMGNAYAGAAASAEDASTIWFNPAGMAELEDGTHISAGVHVVKPTAEFTNNGSVNNLTASPITGTNSTSDKGAYIPNVYAVKPLTNKVKLGVGVNAPYGLETNYDANWVGRYNAIKSNMKSININPSVSYKVNDKVSLGAGVNAQYIDAELTSAVDLATVTRGAITQDGKATITGDDWSYGYNMGALFKPTTKTKVGLSYRSKMNHTLKGTATYDLPAGTPAALVAALSNKDAQAAANLPESLSLSVAHKVNDKVEVLGDITRTNWSSFKELRVINPADGSTITVTPENWKDVNRYSLGMNYKYSDRLKLRTGVALDKEPIPSATDRTPRIPGNDRKWLSVGANYKLNKGMSVDVGYSHLFVKDMDINNTNTTRISSHTLNGTYKADVDIVGAQLNWRF
jgi:long-chain fatty acid transport protein